MKLSPSIFERAAELIASGVEWACCWAIDGACHQRNPFGAWEPNADAHQRLMCKVLNKENKPGYWWHFNEDYDPSEARILALLLCAEMVRDQNRRKKKP